LLERIRTGVRHFTPDELDRIEAAKRHDAFPEDKWAKR